VPLTGEHTDVERRAEPPGRCQPRSSAATSRSTVARSSSRRLPTAEAPSVVTVLTHAPHASQPSARRVSPVVAPTRPRSRACSSVPQNGQRSHSARQFGAATPAAQSPRALQAARLGQRRPRAADRTPGLRVLGGGVGREARAAALEPRVGGQGQDGAQRLARSPAASPSASMRAVSKRDRRLERRQRIEPVGGARERGRRGGGHVEQAAEPGDGDARFEREGRSGEPRRAGGRRVGTASAHGPVAASSPAAASRSSQPRNSGC